MLLVPRPQPPQIAPVLIVGTIPASGVLNAQLDVPGLAPGIASRLVFLQPIFVDTQSQSFLGGARTVLVLP